MRITMRHIIAAALLVVACHQQGTKAQETLPWAPTIDVARQVAARKNQLVLVHFWSHSCAPCLRLEQTVFNDPQVAHSISRDYVPVKVNVDDFPLTAGYYSIEQLPTDVVLTSDGQILFRGISPGSPAEFITHYQQVATASRSAGGTTLAQTMLAQTPIDSNTATNHNAIGQAPAHSAAYQQVLQGYPSRNTAGQVGNAQVAYPPAGTPAQGTYGYAPPSTAPSVSGRQSNLDSNAWANQPVPQVGSRYSSSQGPSNDAGPVAGQAGPAYQTLGPDRYSGVQQNNPREFSQQIVPGFAAQASPVSPGAVLGATLSNPPPYNGIPQHTMTSPGISPPVVPVPAGNTPVGMDGHCPVTLAEQSRWQLGDVRWGAVHRGRTYLFVGSGEQQRFLSNPDFYAPMLSGSDPVEYIERGNVVTGKRQHGVFYRQQVYLFSSEETLDRFWKSPERYHAAAYQAMRQADVNYRAVRSPNRVTTPLR